MKVSEKTFSMWTVVQMHKECVFRNPSYAGESRMMRITSIQNFDAWNIRFWKEFYCQFSEPINQEEQAYVPDSQKQLDMAIEEEVD